ncbi:MAG: threonine synthase [Bacteriovoracaceae bacterium]|jgi:threonine synthase
MELSDAIVQGLSLDGGLFLPIEWGSGLEKIKATSFQEYCLHGLSPFFKGDELEAELPSIIEKALDFPVSLNYYEENHAFLELYHGPTSAFKDFGARFLAEVLSRKAGSKKLTILVATSGDTGGAVASAFYHKPGINVAILFPKGKVSKLQEKQLTCWGDNVMSFRVEGSFDDCQRMVKEAFSNKDLRERYNLTSANSINIGRLLPQMAYHGYSSQLFFEKTGKRPNLVIPTGNLGNGFGALWAKKMGAPIDKVLLATNENKSISHYYQSGTYSPTTSVETLANAMDVGAPSNMERLNDLYPDLNELKKVSLSISVSDQEILEMINESFQKYSAPICPHTAVGLSAAQKLLEKEPYIISSTAHASKFKEVVEPAIGTKLMLPPKLASLLEKESFFFDIEPNLEALFKQFR